MPKNLVQRIGTRGLTVFSLLGLLGLASFIAIGLLSGPVNVNAQTSNTNIGTHIITVTGQAQYTITPDMAYIYYNINAQGSTASDAISATNATVVNLTTKLKADGLTDSDLQSGGVNIYPIYGIRPQIGAPTSNVPTTPVATAKAVPSLCALNQPNCGNTLPASGYRGTTTLTARINDLGKFGSIVTDSITVSNVSMSNTTLTVKDSSAQRNAALTQAVQNSRSQADAIANGLGVKITDVASVTTNASYNGSSNPNQNINNTGVVPGPLTQTVIVTVSYNF